RPARSSSTRTEPTSAATVSKMTAAVHAAAREAAITPAFAALRAGAPALTLSSDGGGDETSRWRRSGEDEGLVTRRAESLRGLVTSVMDTARSDAPGR